MITGGGNLRARFVIHAVGPVWRGGNEDEDAILASAYRNCLRLAVDRHLRESCSMNLSRLLAALLISGLLAAGPGAPFALSGEARPSSNPRSLGHDGVPEKFPERPAIGEEAPGFRLREADGRWR